MENFIKICKTSEIQNNKGRKYMLDDNCEIAVFRINGKFYAFDNICPHNHTPKISEGFIKGDYVICPVHLYFFNINTGKSRFNVGGKLRIFETKVEDDFLFVNLPEKKLFNF